MRQPILFLRKSLLRDVFPFNFDRDLRRAVGGIEEPCDVSQVPFLQRGFVQFAAFTLRHDGHCRGDSLFHGILLSAGQRLQTASAASQLFQAFSLRLLSTAMRPSWMLSLKKSFTEQPARPEEAQAQAQAQDDAQAQCDAQAQDEAQDE